MTSRGSLPADALALSKCPHALGVQRVHALQQLALLVVVDRYQADRQAALAGATVRVRQYLALRLEGLVGTHPRREQIRPVVEHEERAIGVSALAPAAELVDLGRAERRVLYEGEPVEIPGDRAVGVLLGQDDHALVSPHERAQRGQRL